MLTDIGVSKYNMARVQTYGADLSAAANGAVHTGAVATHSIENPMVWLLGIGAVTIGLVGFTTHVRVGKFTASVEGG